jgi:hypothetical protein
MAHHKKNGASTMAGWWFGTILICPTNWDDDPI